MRGVMSRLAPLCATTALWLLAPGPAAAAPDMGPLIPCHAVPPNGCCDGETLKYCPGGSLVTVSCVSQPKCGWNEQKIAYTCGTDGKEDVKYKKACPPAPDAGPPPDAGTDADMGTTQPGSKDDGCSLAPGAAAKPWSVAPAVVLLLLLAAARRRSSSSGS